jgi:hypothetical protein
VPSVNIPYTWQLAQTFGAQSDTVTWSTYRSISGSPTFTVTDIIAYSGTFYRCYMKIDLLDGSNNVHGSGSLWKYWGSNASCGLGAIGPAKSLKLRTKLNIYKNTAGQTDASGSWKATLSW